MSQIHQCQFKTKQNRQCRHHTRPEFPVRFSARLGLYLCAQHEYFIINDHINQYLESQLQYVLTTVDTTYQPFSQEVIRRLITEEDLSHMPYEMSTINCLYQFDIEWFETGNDMIIIRFKIYNDVSNNLIQISSCITLESQNQSLNFDCTKHKSRFLYNTLRYSENVENLCSRIISDRVQVINPSNDVLYYRENIQLLILDYYTRSNQQMEDEIDNDLDISRIHIDNIFPRVSELPQTIISRVPSPVAVDDNELLDRQDLLMTTNIMSQHTNHPVFRGIPGIRPRTSQHTDIKISTINLCLICGSEEIQKGFKMSCCSELNTVCHKCIITNQVLEQSKYCSILEIVNMNMFDEIQNCFLCRHSNTYKDIKYDIDCKNTFIQIVSDKVKEELLTKQAKHMCDMLDNLNM